MQSMTKCVYVCVSRRDKAGSVVTSTLWESIGTLPKYTGTHQLLVNQIIVTA